MLHPELLESVWSQFSCGQEHFIPVVLVLTARDLFDKS